MNTIEISLEIPTAANSSSRTAISTSSAQTPAVVRPTAIPAGQPIPCLVTSDVACYVRRGTNPTAVADGTDMPLLANSTYRVQMLDGEKMAFITASGTGNVSLTVNA